MSDNYELGRDIGKLQVAIESLQARFDKFEGEATVREGIPRIMQEVPESFVSLESIERVADQKYELRLPAGKPLTFRCDFFADYEHLIQCFVYLPGGTLQSIYIRLKSETSSYIDIAWSESPQGTARNAGVVIFL